MKQHRINAAKKEIPIVEIKLGGINKLAKEYEASRSSSRIFGSNNLSSTLRLSRTSGNSS